MKRIAFLFLFTSQLFGQNTAKPWTFWWIMGNALDSANVKRQLVDFKKVGIGGVHLIPIYGSKGYEDKYIDFLSDKHLALLNYTTKEAQNLGLGVDMTLGTGWPFGGKFVDTSISAKKFNFLDDGSLKVSPTFQKVKRASPGAEGLVLDHFDAQSFNTYTSKTGFDKLKNLPIRAFYNDSYEAFDANFTSHFYTKFRALRGYDIQPFMRFLHTKTDSDSAIAIRQDYRETMSDLLLEQFTKPFSTYSHDLGKLSRNQAHGSPGHLLDLYAASDIPETESFGTSRFPIPNVRLDPDFEPERFGQPNIFAMKFASSAAHLADKKLVSSESTTWLGNHFKVSLSQIKPQIDQLFVAGVNHVFYHGTTYSPAKAPYPGWLFYASTHYGPSSHFYPDLPELNGYIERCQNILQNSQSAADVLLYFPVHDLWAKTGNTQVASYPLQMLDVHRSESWLVNTPFGSVATELQNLGYDFDFVSDRFIAQAVLTKDKKIKIGKMLYASVVLPEVKYMPFETLKKLVDLQSKGAKIVFYKEKPRHLSGWNNSPANLNLFHSFISKVNIVSTLIDLGKKEMIPQNDIKYIRKKQNGQLIYFITNLGADENYSPITLATKSNFIEIYRPLENKFEYLASLESFKIQPGEAVFLKPIQTLPSGQKLKINTTKNQIQVINSPWQLSLNQKKYDLATLKSWTELGDSAQYFSGAAIYKTTFDLSKTNFTTLNFENIRETADITLNGVHLGKIWCVPFKISIPKGLLKEQNTLEILVRNLSVNAMIPYDKAHPEWKSFRDINIVDIKYKPLNMSTWLPEPSGILGKVTLSN